MSKKIKAKRCQIRLLDGKLRTMVFDGNAMVNIEDATGMNLLKDMIKLQEMKNPLIFLSKFFWACLVHEEPSLTWERVSELLLPNQVTEAFGIMGKLMGTEADPNSLAPFVPTPEPVVKQALAVSKLKAGERFVDIGCGDGRTLELALREFGAAHVDGYEMDHDRADKCAARLLKEYAGRYTIWEHNFMNMPDEALKPIREADVIFVYLLTASNMKIAPVLEKNCKKGCRVVSHDFTFGNWVGYESKTIKEERTHGIYAYEMGQHLDSSLQVSEVVPDITDINRDEWTKGTNSQGMPVFRFGTAAAVVWDGGRWFGRVAGPGMLPMGPYEDPVTGMVAVEDAVKRQGEKAKAEEAKKPEPVA